MDSGLWIVNGVSGAVGSPSTIRHPPSTAIERTAKDFEALFIAQMLEHMFAEVDLGGLGEGEESGDIYRSWMIEQYGKLITDGGGIGVADHVQRELLKLQEIKEEAL